MDVVEHTMLRHLWRAQNGDDEAHRRVAMYCFDTYKGKLAHFYSSDPAISREDLESTFFMGVWDGVQKADTRGNPLYFVGQYGMWRVQSEVRSIQRRMKERSRVIIGANTWDDDAAIEPMDPEPDFREIVASRLDDHRIVRIIANADLRDRQREAIEIILSGAAGDPSEPGFNKRLAEQMGVCPQRASQLTAGLKKVYEAAA